MRRLVGGLVGLALCAALTAPAAGAASVTTDLTFRVDRMYGTVRVDFAGDPAAGCGRVGRCGITGTEVVTLSPGPMREAGILQDPTIGVFGFVVAGARVNATVSQVGVDAPCVDRFTPLGAPLLVHGNAHRVDVGLGFAPGIDLLTTHCAGPRGEDVQSLPALHRAYTFRHFLHRHVRLDLARASSFRAAGFSGTVRTDVHAALTLCSCVTPRFTG
jgi:hypothetical protein